MQQFLIIWLWHLPKNPLFCWESVFWTPLPGSMLMLTGSVSVISLVTLLVSPTQSPPRSQTACTGLWFNVHCQSEASHSAQQTESYSNMTCTSCQLTLPMERSSCFLTMCNSAGSSPAARLTLPAPTETSTHQVSIHKLIIQNVHKKYFLNNHHTECI